MTTQDWSRAERAAQAFDPLAEMVGEYVRDFVHPKDRVEAIGRLYVLLREARLTADWEVVRNDASEEAAR